MSLSFSYCNSYIQVLKIAHVQIEETIQMHSHAKNCYEIHYINCGKGRLIADGNVYNLSKGNLFITGPGIMHKQITDEQSPMEELCLYLKLNSSKNQDIIFDYFSSHFFGLVRLIVKYENIFCKLLKKKKIKLGGLMQQFQH